jgi:hypothetical protein
MDITARNHHNAGTLKQQNNENSSHGEILAAYIALANMSRSKPKFWRKTNKEHKPSKLWTTVLVHIVQSNELKFEWHGNTKSLLKLIITIEGVSKLSAIPRSPY